MSEITRHPGKVSHSLRRRSFTLGTQQNYLGLSTVRFDDDARGRHTVIYGGTGAGKSRLLELIFVEDVIRRLRGFSQRGAGAIDVVGDLYRNIKSRLAYVRKNFKRLDDLLYLIDPTSPRWSVRYNPLELKHGQVPERLADRLSYGWTVLYHDDPEVVVRLRRVLKHSLWALIIAGGSLPDLPRFLTERDYREGLVEGLGNPALTRYWFSEFPSTDKAALERIESTLNRLDILIDPDISEMLRGPSTIDFRKIMDDGAFVLVNAPKHILGDGSAYLLAAFILLEFQAAALGRLDLPDWKRRPFSLLCDEYQEYTTDSILQIIKGHRKVNLELVLSTQDVRGQPKDEALRRTIRKVAGNIIAFRGDYEDAEILVKDVLTPNLDQVKDTRVRYQKVPGIFGEVSQRFDDAVYRDLREVWELEIRKITQLPDRFFWWKRRGYDGAHLVETPTVSDLEDLPEYENLDEALEQQDTAAFLLAGSPKFKKLPKPRFVVYGPDGKEYIPPSGW